MPARAAEVVLSLARVTGWGERRILYRLPLARLHAYRHAMAIDNGLDVTSTGARAEVHAALGRLRGDA